MLVFSAGLGNIIELVLEKFGVCHDNIRVVSNFMDFNDEVSFTVLRLFLFSNRSN